MGHTQHEYLPGDQLAPYAYLSMSGPVVVQAEDLRRRRGGALAPGLVLVDIVS